jgi:hypothetical protein
VYRLGIPEQWVDGNPSVPNKGFKILKTPLESRSADEIMQVLFFLDSCFYIKKDKFVRRWSGSQAGIMFLPAVLIAS